jgi:hypothetical protein
VGENISSYTSDKGLKTRIFRELKKLNSPPKSMNQRKWATELNNFFKGRNPNSQKTHEKMLTIPDHKGNAN